jgi:polar amino acid transport system substrate-binding protein
MKYTGVTLAAAIALAFAVATQAKADVLGDIKARGSVICGVLGDSGPFAYQDPGSRQLVGYEIDLCNDLAKNLNAKADIKVISPQARIPELLQGRVDFLVALISYTDERAKQVDFSGSYITDSFRCAARKDSDIKKMEDIAGKRVGLQKGGNLDPVVLAQFPTAQIISYDEVPTKFVSLQQGKVDVACDRATVLRTLQLRAGDDGSTIILPGYLGTARVKAGFAVRKGDPTLVPYLNKFLIDYDASGKGKDLFDKWLGDKSAYKLPYDFKIGETIN